MPFANAVDYRIPTLRPQLWGAAIDNYVNLDLPDSRWMLSKLESVAMGCPTFTARPSDPCVQSTWGTPEGFQSTTSFSPFRVEESITCSTIGAWSPDELTEWATREARATISAALARQVWAGLYTIGASTLASEADDVTASATNPLDALAAVEYGLGQRLFGQGMVHMTVDVLTRLVSAGAVKLFDGRYFTPSGNIVVADYGYFHAQAGQFIYGSGMVGFDMAEWDVSQAWKADHNDYIVYVNTWAVVEFEPCAVVKSAVTAPAPANFGGV